MPIGVREVQPTPNPNANKFLLDRILTTQAISRRSGGETKPEELSELHQLVDQFLGLKGVTAVLLLNDFVTINKSSEARWADINRKVKQILAKTDLTES